MSESRFDVEGVDVAWCPGCGDFGILKIMKRVFEELDSDPTNVVMVSGIGQAAKLPQYIATNYFNGLHGRALPVATAVKAANPGLTVVAESGDGDIYGEGGNHFIHAVRRNPDITCIVHDNMVYGLTKGQASPTSRRGFKTPVQVSGVASEPFNPMAVAIAADAAFAARAYVGDIDETVDIVKRAITHRGFSVVDILQPCPSFNRVNTYAWFKDHTEYLDEGHDSSSRTAAFAASLDDDPLRLGVFYAHEKPTFEEAVHSTQPAFAKKRDMKGLAELIKEMSA